MLTGVETTVFEKNKLAILRLIAGGASFPQTLKAIVDLVESQQDDLFCTLFLLAPSTQSLYGGVAGRAPSEYLEAVNGKVIGPRAGSCGAAAYHGKPILVEDISTHPNWEQYREAAALFGFKACWSSPILAQDKTVLGTFAIFYKVCRRPTSRERDWVAGATDIAAIAIERERSREALEASERAVRNQARLYSVASRVNTLVGARKSPEELYSSVCQIPVEEGIAVMAWIGRYREDKDAFDVLACAGAGTDYLSNIRLSLKDPNIRDGPAGRALRTGQPALSMDVLQDEGFFWKEEARKRGYRSCLVLPLRLQQSDRGIFAIYSPERDSFGTEETSALASATENLSFVLDVLQGESQRLILLEALDRRVTELSSLHQMSRTLQSDLKTGGALLPDIARIICQGFRHPELVRVEITWANRTSCAGGLSHSSATEETTLLLGNLSVAVARNNSKSATLSQEERDYLKSASEMLNTHFQRLASARRFEVLQTLSEYMSEGGDVDSLLQRAVELLGRQIGASRCNYGLVEDDEDLFRVPFDYSDGCDSVTGHMRLSDFGTGITKLMATSNRVIVSNDTERDFPGNQGAEQLRPVNVRAFVCVRLHRGDKLKALLTLHQTVPRQWTPHEITLAEEVAERCWSLIEQRGAEEELRRRDHFLEMAGRVARIGGWSVTLPNLFTELSDEAQVILSRSTPTGSIHDVMGAFQPQYQGAILQAIKDCLGQGIPFDLEAKLQSDSEVEKWVRLVGQEERSPTGAVVSVQGTLQDVSQRHRLEHQLQQTQKLEAVGQLAGGIAHDFNNLMTVVLSYAEFALETLPEDHEVYKDIQEIRLAGERAAELTGQLLAFSRRQVLSPRVMCLNTVLNGMRGMLHRLVGEKVQLNWHLVSDLRRLRADSGQMEQVLLNLVVNARDSMPEGGVITIQTSNTKAVGGPGVQLEVVDQGHGMTEEVKARIFEPFYTTKPSGKGTGLGLSTVWGIITQSGGEISIDSKPGQGSIFRVVLPATDDPLEEKPRVSTVYEASKETAIILLVEDDPQVREALSASLCWGGYEVLVAQNAGEAILISEQTGSIDLLVTDIVMPVMNGVQLAARISEQRPDLRVLLISGYAEELPDLSKAHQRTDFLPKPFQPSEFLQRVRRLLSPSAQTRLGE